MHRRQVQAIFIALLLIIIYIVINVSYRLIPLWMITYTISSVLVIITVIIYQFQAVKWIKASLYVKHIETLNKETSKKILNIESFQIHEAFNRKNQLDRAHTKSFLEEVMYHQIPFYTDLVNKIKHNVTLKTSYEQTRKDIKATHQIESLSTIKKHILNQEARHLTLNIPTHQSVTVKLTYTSPRGRNHYEKKQAFPLISLETILDHVINLKRHHETVAYQRQQERNKLSSRMRFMVFKRDDYTCQICGKSKHDGIKLHVDHIIPIAKGGETKLYNLQTLCETCNLGKSDLHM